MTKTEFLEYLEKRLHVLNQKERDDILSEYAQHIELKMESGLSEEDAIHDFGDLEELAAEILDAYNVNPDYSKKTLHIDRKKIGKRMTRTGHKVGGAFQKGSQAVKNLFKGNSKSRFKEIFKVCLILVILFVVYVPLAGLDFLIGDCLYSMFGSPLDVMLSSGVIIGFHLFYLYLAVSVLYTYITDCRRRRDEEYEDGLTEVYDGRPEMEKVGTEEYKMNEEGMEEEGTKDGNPRKRGNRRLKKVSGWFRKLFILPGFSRKEAAAGEKRKIHWIRTVWNMVKACVSFMVKGIVLCCLAPVFMFLLFWVVVFGTLVVLVFLGYPLIGVTVISFGGLLSGFAFIWFIGSFLFSKKEGKEV